MIDKKKGKIMYTDIKNFLPSNILFFNEPLKKHTTFRIGGAADLLITPQSEEQLIKLFKYIRPAKSP